MNDVDFDLEIENLNHSLNLQVENNNDIPLSLKSEFASGGIEEAKVIKLIQEQLAEFDEKDPTVPAWAKEETKPSYTAEEVGALPKNTPIPSIEGLATETYVKEYAQPKGNYLTEHQSLKGYATESWVNTQGFLKQHQSLAGYATEKWVEAKGYLTEHQSLVDYAKKKDIPTTLPASDVYAWAKKPSKPTYTASEVGADSAGSASKALDDAKAYTDKQIAAIPTPDVSGQIGTHNTSTTSHNDIRLLIDGLTERLNALANSDDETLDQMSEVVEYIKDNRELIESVTTSKVAVSDIIDNLETNVSDRPLSAAQGVALKALVDAIKVPTKVSELENDKEYLTEHQPLDDYAKKSELPTKVSELENDKEYLTEHQSLAGYATEQWVEDKKYLTQHQSLAGYATESWVEGKGYLTEIDKQEITNSVLSALPTWTGGSY